MRRKMCFSQQLSLTDITSIRFFFEAEEENIKRRRTEGYVQDQINYGLNDETRTSLLFNEVTRRKVYSQTETLK